MTITEAAIQALADDELAQLVLWAHAEQGARERRRKEDAIAKIRALAGEVGLSVAISGARGRPGGKAPKKRADADTQLNAPPMKAASATEG